MPIIETRATKLRVKGEDANREYVQKSLIDKGNGVITDWKPAGKVDARIYEGAWIVDCPRPHCNNAEFADPEWPLFVCRNCGLGPLTVTFPKERAAIEAALLDRPVPQTRNWYPHETLADLRRENKEMI